MADRPQQAAPGRALADRGTGDRPHPAAPLPRPGIAPPRRPRCRARRRVRLPPRHRPRRLAHGRAHHLRPGRRRALRARLGGQPQPSCRPGSGPGMCDGDPHRRARPGPLGLRALRQLPMRHGLRRARGPDRARTTSSSDSRPSAIRPPPASGATPVPPPTRSWPSPPSCASTSTEASVKVRTGPPDDGDGPDAGTARVGRRGPPADGSPGPGGRSHAHRRASTCPTTCGRDRWHPVRPPGERSPPGKEHRPNAPTDDRIQLSTAARGFDVQPVGLGHRRIDDGPSTTLTPSASAGSARAAACHPRSAISRT